VSAQKFNPVPELPQNGRIFNLNSVLYEENFPLQQNTKRKFSDRLKFRAEGTSPSLLLVDWLAG